MHELAVTQSLINSVLTECKNRNITKLENIIVELGSLTSYVSDSIHFYYDLLKEPYELLHDVHLIIHEVQGIIHCNACKKETTIDDSFIIMCKHCHSTDVHIVKGKEFIIKSLEIKGDE
jgi:hydrogenase nickel insertion protein HypA